jgi:predicted phosphodiesterase
LKRAAIRPLALSLALLAAPVGCLDVADGRARLDLLVGHAEGPGWQVDVDGGLAAVRAIDLGAIHLRAQAPTLAFRASMRAARGAGPLSVTIDNVLPDAVLVATTADGTPLAVAAAEAPLPTRKRWTLQAPEAAALSFELRPPDAGVLEPWRFAVFGDVQDAIDRVQDIYQRMNADPGLRFALIAGDLTQQGTADELDRFQRELDGLAIPCYATLGNHELGAAEGLFQERYGRGSFHFAFRGVRFTLLDSASAMVSPLASEWLTGWLDDAAALPHVLVMHIPPLDPTGVRNGAFASRGEAAALLARLAAAAVDVTFYGHIHSFRAFANAGIPAYITGGGGAIPERFDGIGRHYLAVDVDPGAARFEVAIVRVYPEE